MHDRWWLRIDSRKNRLEIARVCSGSYLVLAAIVFLAGCHGSLEPSDTAVSHSSEAMTIPLPDVPDSKYKFEPAVMLTVDGEPIAVEEPGYACPTIADVDGDGADDLVVGQFTGGKMHFYRNLSAAEETPRYAARQWINSGSTPAEVPGVS